MMNKEKGFTLIELMIVVAIIAVIAAIAIPSLMQSRMAANETKAVGALKAYGSAQAIYQRRKQVYANDFTLLNTDMALIDSSFAGAKKGLATEVPYSGYLFVDLLTGLNYNYEYALGAEAAAYDKTGVMTYFTDQTGVMWQKDTGAGFTGTTVPTAPDANGWAVVGK